MTPTASLAAMIVGAVGFEPVYAGSDRLALEGPTVLQEDASCPVRREDRAYTDTAWATTSSETR